MVVKSVLPCQECLCSYHPVISHLSKWQTWRLPAQKQEIWPARPEQCDWDKHTPPCLTTWTTALVMCLRACFSTWPVAMDISASRQPSINPVSGQTDRQRHSLSLSGDSVTHSVHTKTASRQQNRHTQLSCKADLRSVSGWGNQGVAARPRHTEVKHFAQKATRGGLLTP